MNVTDEDILAYVASELARDDAARIEAAIAADVMVAARVEREKRLRAKVRGAHEPVLDEPVPDRLHALLEAADDGTSRATSRAASERNVVEPQPHRVPLPARWRTPVIAIAATVAALAVSTWSRPGAPVQMRDGVLVAQGRLARDLDAALASAPQAHAATSIKLTFRDTGGRICRSFTNSDITTAGLACREGERWVLPVVTRIEAGEGGGLRQASSAMPAEVQAAVDARLEGDVFDVTQERAARDAGWR